MTVSDREARARRAVADLVEGRALSDAGYQELRGHLVGYVRSKFPGVPDSIATEMVDESITRLLAKIDSGDHVNPVIALALVRRILYNLVVDHLRRNKRDGLSLDDVGPQLLSDDAIARLVHESATAQSVERLLSRAAADRDQVTTRVINAYLNLAGALGKDPSSRTVASEAGVSHTTVQNVLAKLKQRLSDEDFPD